MFMNPTFRDLRDFRFNRFSDESYFLRDLAS